ncbi:T9SS type A sorting domain-containing protein [Lewinella sp. IMCC34183]|uniref:T9SS type A sorting domain-containing protein n=1 Tax=Lewinella sp. IMCC34183 TaxID=2248762 RepID=UPI000E22AEDE|nr:T9SS type A sorting domain-containing protein [Lewinella sp. IMCC34183]
MNCRFFLLLAGLLLAAAPLSSQSLVANIHAGTGGSEPTGLKTDNGFAAWFARTGDVWQLYYVVPETTEPELFPELPELPSSAPAFGLIDGNVYFHVPGDTSTVFYRADLTSTTLHEVTDLPAASSNLGDPRYTRQGDRVLFIHQPLYSPGYLYATDGTPEGTEMLIQLYPGYTTRKLNSIGDRVWIEFTSSSSNTDTAPYAFTDGTPEGSQLRWPAEEIDRLEDPVALPFGVVARGTSANGEEMYLLNRDLTAASPLRQTIPSLPPGTLMDFQLRGEKAYFMRRGSRWESSMWELDIATREAREVLDLNPAEDKVFTYDLSPLGEFWTYTVFDCIDGTSSLHRTDGTAGGTFRLTENPNMRFHGLYSRGSGVIGRTGMRFFPAYLPETGIELWRTDGTVAGTFAVDDLYPGTVESRLSNLTIWKDGILFTAESPLYGSEVFFSSGSAGSAEIVVDINTETSGSKPRPRAVVGRRLVVEATTPGTGTELFTVDTAGKVELLIDAVWGKWGSFPDVFADSLSDTGLIVTNSNWGNYLYRTDGTPGGTVRLDARGQLNPTGPISGPGQIGDALYFLKIIGRSENLLAYDAATDSFKIVKVINPYSDGIIPGPAFATLNDSVLLFRAENRDGEVELWRTDGTEEGTYTIKGTVEQPAYGPLENVSFPVVADGVAYFRAIKYNPRLWRTDGTEAGSWELRGSERLAWPEDVFLFGDRVHFPAGPDDNRKLYTTGGERDDVLPSPITEGSVYEALEQFTSFGRQLVFTATTADAGNELWVTSDPESAAIPLGDLNAGPADARPLDLYAYNDSTLLFSAFVPELGRELWTSDGTAEGTVVVADMNPGTASADPRDFLRYGDFVYFSADDGRIGHELWKYSPADLDNDGTIDGSCAPGAGCPDPDKSTATTGPEPMHLSVFPNPTAEVLIVETAAYGNLRLQLFRTDGRQVLSTRNSGRTHLLDVRHLPAGTYVLRVSGDSLRVGASRLVTVLR